MSQVAKKWLKINSVDHTRLDPTDNYTILDLQVTNLAGTGNRPIYSDSSGNLTNTGAGITKTIGYLDGLGNPQLMTIVNGIITGATGS